MPDRYGDDPPPTTCPTGVVRRPAPAAVNACGLCDDDGLAGGFQCDHVDRAATDRARSRARPGRASMPSADARLTGRAVRDDHRRRHPRRDDPRRPGRRARCVQARVGHAIQAIEDRSQTPRIGIRNAGLVLDGLAAELRAYVAELTYEGMP